jgi:methyl-galactoside transport system ATP-binding protein
MNSQYLLEIKDISKSFPGVKALDGVHLQVRPGTVHSLMGENGAGKSTLMKCLFGIYIQDEGSFKLNGEEVNFTSPKNALENGVSMVHQELNQVLTRNVMDNIWLGRYPMKFGMIDEHRMYEDTLEIFKSLNMNIDPRAQVADLSVSQRQMIEIAKAVSYDSKIIVMDEPSSSLTEKEVGHLFKIIETLRDSGHGIIYISHKMEEILQISDDVTIMRDGKWIATEKAEDLTTDRIISLMVGRDLSHLFPEKHNHPGDVIMEIKNLTGTYQPTIKDVSFELRAGEILGVAGLVGARRTEVVESIFGYRKVESGEIWLHGRKIDNKTPLNAMKNGFALITEERRETGLFGMSDITFNSTIANIDSYKTKLGYLSNKKMETDTQWVIDSMRVKTPNAQTLIRSLSGGNQQKVIIGRWLLNNPEILMMDEPTRGIDVGAKYEIYQLMISLAEKGKGVIMVSSEMPELLGVTDRIMVMSNGRVAGIVNTSETTQEEILELSAKYL